MADLSRSAIGAAEHLTIEDQAAADAGTDGDIDHVPASLPGAAAVFGPGRDVGVIVKHRGYAEALGERVADGHAFPVGQVGGGNDYALFKVNVAGQGDADALKIPAGKRLLAEQVVSCFRFNGLTCKSE